MTQEARPCQARPAPATPPPDKVVVLCKCNSPRQSRRASQGETTLKSQKVTITFKQSLSIQTLYHSISLPVVPHKAVAEVSKIGNL